MKSFLIGNSWCLSNQNFNFRYVYFRIFEIACALVLDPIAKDMLVVHVRISEQKP